MASKQCPKCGLQMTPRPVVKLLYPETDAVLIGTSYECEGCGQKMYISKQGARA